VLLLTRALARARGDAQFHLVTRELPLEALVGVRVRVRVG